jgi:hypothetical protein
VFKELYLAEPSDDGGNPFGIDSIEACVIPIQSEKKAKAFGVDLAKEIDNTWVIGLDEDGRECVSVRFKSDWQQTKNRVIQVIGDTPSLVDSTGVGDPITEDICRQAPGAKGFKISRISKQQLMEGLAAAIQQKRIGFNDPTLIEELKSFEYEYTDSGVRYTCPSGLHDDGVIALALAVRQLETPQPMMNTGFKIYGVR